MATEVAAKPSATTIDKKKESEAQRREREDGVLEYASRLKADLKKLQTTDIIPAVEPHRTACHWDYVLREMMWLANDVMQERLWKQAAACQVARAILTSGQQAKLRRVPKPVVKNHATGAGCGADCAVDKPGTQADGTSAENGKNNSAGLTTCEQDGLAPATPPLPFHYPASDKLQAPAAAHLLERAEERLLQHALALHQHREALVKARQDAEQAVHGGQEGVLTGADGKEVLSAVTLGEEEEVPVGKKPRRKAKAAHHHLNEDGTAAPPLGTPGGAPKRARGGTGGLGTQSSLPSNRPLPVDGEQPPEEGRGRREKRKRIRADYEDDEYTPAHKQRMDGKMMKLGRTPSEMGALLAAGVPMGKKAGKAQGKGGMGGAQGRLDAMGKMTQLQQRQLLTERQGRQASWTPYEDQLLFAAVSELGQHWPLVADALNSTAALQGIFRKHDACKARHSFLMSPEAMGEAGADPHVAQLVGMQKSQAREVLAGSLPSHQSVLRRHQEAVAQQHHLLSLKRNQERAAARETGRTRTEAHSSHAQLLNAAMQKGRHFNPLEFTSFIPEPPAPTYPVQNHVQQQQHLQLQQQQQQQQQQQEQQHHQPQHPSQAPQQQQQPQQGMAPQPGPANMQAGAGHAPMQQAGLAMQQQQQQAQAAALAAAAAGILQHSAPKPGITAAGDQRAVGGVGSTPNSVAAAAHQIGSAAGGQQQHGGDIRMPPSSSSMQAALGARGGGVANSMGSALSNLPALQHLNPQQKQQVLAALARQHQQQQAAAQQQQQQQQHQGPQLPQQQQQQQRPSGVTPSQGATQGVQGQQPSLGAQLPQQLNMNQRTMAARMPSFPQLPHTSQQMPSNSGPGMTTAAALSSVHMASMAHKQTLQPGLLQQAISGQGRPGPNPQSFTGLPPQLMAQIRPAAASNPPTSTSQGITVSGSITGSALHLPQQLQQQAAQAAAAQAATSQHMQPHSLPAHLQHAAAQAHAQAHGQPQHHPQQPQHQPATSQPAMQHAPLTSQPQPSQQQQQQQLQAQKVQQLHAQQAPATSQQLQQQQHLLSSMAMPQLHHSLTHAAAQQQPQSQPTPQQLQQHQAPQAHTSQPQQHQQQLPPASQAPQTSQPQTQALTQAQQLQQQLQHQQQQQQQQSTQQHSATPHLPALSPMAHAAAQLAQLSQLTQAAAASTSSAAAATTTTAPPATMPLTLQQTSAAIAPTAAATLAAAKQAAAGSTTPSWPLNVASSIGAQHQALGNNPATAALVTAAAQQLLQQHQQKQHQHQHQPGQQTQLQQLQQLAAAHSHSAQVMQQAQQQQQQLQQAQQQAQAQVQQQTAPHQAPQQQPQAQLQPAQQAATAPPSQPQQPQPVQQQQAAPPAAGASTAAQASASVAALQHMQQQIAQLAQVTPAAAAAAAAPPPPAAPLKPQ